MITLPQAKQMIEQAGNYKLFGVTTPRLSLGDWLESIDGLIDIYSSEFGMKPAELVDWIDASNSLEIVECLESKKFTLLS